MVQAEGSEHSTEGMLNAEVRRTNRRLSFDNVRICRGLPGLAEFDDNREVIRPGDGLNKVAAVCLPRPKWMSVGGRRLWSLGNQIASARFGRPSQPIRPRLNKTEY